MAKLTWSMFLADLKFVQYRTGVWKCHRSLPGESHQPVRHCEKYCDTPPTTLLRHFCKSMPSSWFEVVYTPPIYMPCTPHLYRGRPPTSPEDIRTKKFGFGFFFFFPLIFVMLQGAAWAGVGERGQRERGRALQAALGARPTSGGSRV